MPPSANEARTSTGIADLLGQRFALRPASAPARLAGRACRLAAWSGGTAAGLRQLRSSAALAPISWTPYFSSTPFSLKRQRQVQPGLPADGGQHGIGAFLGDDGFQRLGRERLDVGGVGQISGSVMIVAGLELTSTTR